MVVGRGGGGGGEVIILEFVQNVREGVRRRQMQRGEPFNTRQMVQNWAVPAEAPCILRVYLLQVFERTCFGWENRNESKKILGDAELHVCARDGKV